MAFPHLAVLDDFNRDDADTLGADWSPFMQSGNDAGIVDNQAYDANETWNGVYYDPSTYGPNCEVYATYAAIPATNETGLDLYIRLQDVTPDAWEYDGYVMVWYRDGVGSHTLSVKRIDNAVGTQLGASVSITPNDGDVYGLRAAGDTLIGYMNGVEKLTRNDATYSAAGYIGFGFGNEANWRLDDFGGGTIELSGCLRRRLGKY